MEKPPVCATVVWQLADRVKNLLEKKWPGLSDSGYGLWRVKKKRGNFSWYRYFKKNLWKFLETTENFFGTVVLIGFNGNFRKKIGILRLLQHQLKSKFEEIQTLLDLPLAIPAWKVWNFLKFDYCLSFSPFVFRFYLRYRRIPTLRHRSVHFDPVIRCWLWWLHKIWLESERNRSEMYNGSLVRYFWFYDFLSCQKCRRLFLHFGKPFLK